MNLENSVLDDVLSILEADLVKAGADYQAQFDGLEGDFRDQLQGYAERLANDEISPAEFRRYMETTIRTTYTKAYRLGASLETDQRTILTDADRDTVRKYLADELIYLDNFAQDLKENPDLSAAYLAARTDLYGQAIDGLWWAGRTSRQDDGTLIYWETDPSSKDMCDPCKQAEANGPYTQDTLPGMPGADVCEGLDRCRCKLRYESPDQSADIEQAALLKYSDDEPRDEKGQWTSSGPSKEAVSEQKHDEVTREFTREYGVPLRSLQLIRVSVDSMTTTEDTKEKEVDKNLTEAYKKGESKGGPFGTLNVRDIPPPLVALRSDGTRAILDGHHRWLAAQAAGEKQMWVLQAPSSPGVENFISALNMFKVAARTTYNVGLSADLVKAPGTLSAIASAIAELKPLKKERAIILDRGGRVWKRGGGHDSVWLGPIEARDLAGNTFLHNHPSGVSLSPDDCASACAMRFAQVFAIGRTGYTYSILPPEGSDTFEPKHWPAIKAAALQADEATRAALTKMLAEGKIDDNWANINFWHLVWLQIAQATGVRYLRTGDADFDYKQVYETHPEHVAIFDPKTKKVDTRYRKPDDLSSDADATFQSLLKAQEEKHGK